MAFRDLRRALGARARTLLGAEHIGRPEYIGRLDRLADRQFETIERLERLEQQLARPHRVSLLFTGEELEGRTSHALAELELSAPVAPFVGSVSAWLKPGAQHVFRLDTYRPVRLLSLSGVGCEIVRVRVGDRECSPSVVRLHEAYSVGGSGPTMAIREVVMPAVHVQVTVQLPAPTGAP